MDNSIGETNGRNRIARTFLTGVVVAVPFIITVIALWWLGRMIDDAVRRYVPRLPPGLALVFGLVVGLAAFYAVGLLARLYLARKLGRVAEWTMLRIPLARSLYEAARDLMRFFGGGRAGGLGQVVQISLDEDRIRMLGLMTNENPRGAGPPEEGKPGRVAVYLPMSYQLGGFTVYVRRDQVQPMDMSVEQAMKVAATADVG